jgi:type IV pilus assembly protein PilC
VFKRLFAELHSSLPGPTLVIIGVANFVRSIFFLAFVAAVIFAVILGRRWVRTERGKVVWDTFKMRIPIIGKVVHKAGLARFTSTLSSLVESGVPLIDALEISADTANNAIIASAILDAREGVREGLSLAYKLQEHPVMPPMVIQMIDTGEQTGALDAMLQKIAQFYDSEVKAAVESLTSTLEPVLIAILGAIVGTIVISLYLPMFFYIKNIQNMSTS